MTSRIYKLLKGLSNEIGSGGGVEKIVPIGRYFYEEEPLKGVFRNPSDQKKCLKTQVQQCAVDRKIGFFVKSFPGKKRFYQYDS